MTVINTNISSLIGMNNLRLTNLGLQTSLARLSSGLRINWAADDPSGLAIAKGMEAQIGGIRTAVQNAEDGINLIRTADGSLAATHEILLRMRDLAVRAANEATLTSADLTRLDDEFQSLVAEIDRKADAVTFNTKNLFNGDYAAGQVLQIGADNAGTYQLTVTIQTLSSVAGLGLADNLTNLANAQAAITAVQSAIDIVSDVRSNLGIQERRLNYIIDDLKAADINISAAKSRIMDADMAVEISEFTRLQILQQSGTAILAQANAQPQSILQLLR
ncbi:MAG TPA: flagellin [bacterium]|nr:flagellin [bacterium]